MGKRMFAQRCLMTGSRVKPAAGDNVISMPVVRLCNLLYLSARHVSAMRMNLKPKAPDMSHVCPRCIALDKSLL